VKTDSLKEGSAKAMEKLADDEKQWDKLKAGRVNKDFDINIKEIKSKLIPKKDTIVMFDEEHESDPEYQKMKEQAVFLGYNVIRMTATFKGKKKDPIDNKLKPIPFSITTSYPRVIRRINKTKLKDNLTILFSYGKSKTRAITKRSLAILKQRAFEVSGVEEKKEGLVTSVCEKCEREFPFHKLVPNDRGELFCLEECFKAYQSEEREALKAQILQLETKG
jgi:hypothetical protein